MYKLLELINTYFFAVIPIQIKVENKQSTSALFSFEG